MKMLRVLVLMLFAGVGFVTVQGCTPSATHRSAGETVDDATITARVKTALIAEKGIAGNAVKVETYRGVVQLSGFVDSADQVTRAGEIAGKVNGVQSVRNDVRVKPQS